MTGRHSARVGLPELRTIAVWDLPTRLFKWSLVVFVSLAFLVSSSHPYGSLFLVHIACGYAVTLLLLFRLAWGIIGGEHARFRSFVHGWRSAYAYGQGLLRLKPPATAGHNPVGGWMIVTLLATLFIISLSGLLAEGRTGGAGLLSALLPAESVAVVGNIHAWLGFTVMWLVALHVAGVLFESLLHRENLVLTMITGRKWVDDPARMDAGRASGWRAVVLVVVLTVIGLWLAVDTHVPPAPAGSTANAP
jgi:cytochrome b